MAVLKPKLQGRADMGKISGLVKAKLQWLVNSDWWMVKKFQK
jgi:hypothetical protein